MFSAKLLQMTQEAAVALKARATEAASKIWEDEIRPRCEAHARVGENQMQVRLTAGGNALRTWTARNVKYLEDALKERIEASGCHRNVVTSIMEASNQGSDAAELGSFIEWMHVKVWW